MENLILFKSENHNKEVLVNLPSDLIENWTKLESKQTLMNWLHNKHNDIWWDIEMQETFNSSHGLQITKRECGTCVEDIHTKFEIDFWGDNGVFKLVEVKPETL